VHVSFFVAVQISKYDDSSVVCSGAKVGTPPIRFNFHVPCQKSHSFECFSSHLSLLIHLRNARRFICGLKDSAVCAPRDENRKPIPAKQDASQFRIIPHKYVPLLFSASTLIFWILRHFLCSLVRPFLPLPLNFAVFTPLKNLVLSFFLRGWNFFFANTSVVPDSHDVQNVATK
jgi:hypothetical protein